MGYELEGLYSILAMSNIFHFSIASKPDLGSTKPPIKLVLRALSLG